MRARGRRGAVPRVRGARHGARRRIATQCSSSRCTRCWPTHSWRSAASLPRVRPPSEPWPRSRGLPGLREAVGRSTAPGLCRVWWALASAHLGRTRPRLRPPWKRLLAEESDAALQALYGTHAFLCEVLRLRGDLPGALAHGRRAVELAEERGSVFSRVEAAAFLGAAELADGDSPPPRACSRPALALARGSAHRTVVRAAHPGDARGREAGRRRSLRSPRAPRRSA